MIGGRNKIRKKIIRAKAGFTLVEVIVSVALFSIIILSATQIFKLVIDGQRTALATQNVQESLKYFLEVIAKEIRMAQKNNGVCSGIPDDQIFVVSGTNNDTLSFKNYYGQCVSYTLAADGDNQRFRVTRNTESDFISPAKIRIEDLHFVLDNSVNIQPTVTINLSAYALNQAQFRSDMTIQTSISSRYYK